MAEEIELDIDFVEVTKTSASGMHFSFKDHNGSGEYKVLKTDFENLVPFMIKGRVHGLFVHKKRGITIGIQLVKPLELKD